MKRKISKIFGVGLALVLVLSLSLVAAAPVAASPDVSDVWAQLDDYAVDTSATYHVYFTPGADLAKDVDTITVFFPIDTVPTDPVTVIVDPDGDAVAATPGTATADVAGYRLVVTTPVDITAGSEVRLDIPSVKNPTTGGDYTLNVYTSQETTQVESSSYEIGADQVFSVTAFAPTDEVAGAATGDYTVTFTPTNELAVWDTITVIFPTGTDLPAMDASDVTIKSLGGVAAPLLTDPVIDGRFVTLTIPESVWTGGTLQQQIVFAIDCGITNPTYAGTGYDGKVYTSEDLGIKDAGSLYTVIPASISQVAFDAETSASSVMVDTASDDITIQTQDQYGNLKGVPFGVTVTFDLTSSSTTGLFRTNAEWAAVSVDIVGTADGTANFAEFQYKDTTAGIVTITAENAAHGWSDTWEIEVTPETAVELWDGDTRVGEYATITLALADALAGNVIKAGPGTYVEDITIAVAELTLESTDGAAVTTIEGGGITISAADVTVDGFTMENTATIMTISGAGVTVKNNILTAEPPWVMGISLTGTGATISGNELDINSTMNVEASDCTLSDNTFGAGIDLVSVLSGDCSNITITGNTIIGSEFNGITLKTGSFTDILIEGNTISETIEGEGTGINVHTSAENVANLVITGNDITDNEHIGILIANSGTWTDNVIKFNTISGNADYGVENTRVDETVTVDATHNYWGDDTGPGGEGTGMGDAVSTLVDYDPWFVTTVSAGEFAIAKSSLDARATVGVKVSGADSTNQKICVARYTENPMALPEFTPLTDGFFDVYVKEAGTATEIGIKFYADGMTAQSKVYVWDFFEEVWAECSDQKYNATYGYIWVKVRTVDDVPTVPLISDLAGTPFAISTEEVGVRTLQSIEVTPAAPSIGVGGTKQFTATGTYNLAPLTDDITATVTWASSVTSVASIDATGLATGVAEGTTNITATLDTIVSPAAVLTVSEVDILAYYRGLGEDPNVVELTDLIKAANDWANEVVPPDFTEPISLIELIALANEWAATE